DEVSSSENGLSQDEAECRLQENGKNKLDTVKGKSLIRRFFEQLVDPMIIVLLVAAIISGVLAIIQKDNFADAIIILVVVIVNAGLGVYQENKAEKAIEVLQKMSAAKSKVLRDGKIKIVNSEDLVIGDIVLLEAGDAIPADGRILECASLKIEEAALTGESVPITKTADKLTQSDKDDVPLGDRKNMVYSGSTVVYGRGKMVVTGTGMDTEMGKIAGALAQAEKGKTPLQVKLGQLSKILTWIIVGVCALVFVVQLLKAQSFTFEFVLNSFMIAVSLAVAAVPEGLAAVVTIVLSIGVTNMSKRNAIVRKLTAVETLGCTQIICSDKTGTLTQNKMTVTDCFGESKEEIAIAMALCNDAEINSDGSVTGEPTETALVEWANNLGQNKSELKAVNKRIGEAPFDSMRKMMSTVHQTDNGIVQYTKGAPDEIINRCKYYLCDGEIIPITEEYRQMIENVNKSMADNALRVLACAKRLWEEPPESYEADCLEDDMCFIGLCGMIDPVRPEVKAAIAECREAGIRPIMITGDHINTAVAIAKELDILTEDTYAVTGSQLNEMTDEELNEKFQSISVYARVQPEHKTRIVNAWKKAGYITAMTGDGVNDAPSIKSADIGIGMGITGTDVTKNVADVVLADDNFATIVNSVEEGRRIYDNIRKAIQFLLGSNLGEILTVFVATLIGFSTLKPVQLLWINLISDSFPAFALGTEAAEKDVMTRKPRKVNDGILANGMGVDILYQGFLVAALVLLSYLVGIRMETGAWGLCESAIGTSMAFLTLAFA
ncbi:MAG: calcium-translocating P-type ATPase, PMCA-type, partial [Candidatus Scatosoma sp.]